MSDLRFNSPIRNSAGKSSGISATIFLILFATPFAGFGLVALVLGVKKVIAGQTKDGLMLCLFGLIFSTVGFGLMFGAIWGRKKSKQTAEVQARFPDKPWMARAGLGGGKNQIHLHRASRLLFALVVSRAGHVRARCPRHPG